MIEPSQEPILDELNPTAQETEIELQEFPDPELVPTSEVELNASEPLPEFQPAMDEPAVETIDWSYLTVPKLNNYVPRESSIPETDTEGSVFMASFERENSIGSFLNRGSSRDPSKVDTSVFNVVEHLNPDQMPDLYHYAFDMSQDDINETSARLQRERKNQAILDAHPWQAFGAGFITSGVLDPINYLPFGAVYNRARKAASVGKVFGQGALAGIASTTTQEAALHNTQLTRSVEESIWNVTVSSILGGALGAGTAMASKELKMPKEQAKFAYDQIMESIIDPYKGPRGSAGAMARHVREESLADLPQWVKSFMKLSPLSRLASSDYKTANRFANDFLQNGFITRGNLEGETGGGSVETLTNLRLRQSYNHIVEYQDAYLRMLGIESGPAKKIRSLVTTKPEMSSAEFGDRVSRSLFLDTTDDNAFVRDGVNALKPVFESYKKELVELGKLENIEGTRTSAGYIPIMKNKKLILEQGGRDARGPGTYPQAVFEGFQRSRDAAKEFSETPFYKEKISEINSLDKVKDKDLIDNIKADIKTNAPKYTIDDEGNLFPFDMNDEVLWAKTEQHVDRILGHQEDLLLNPFIEAFNRPNSLMDRTLLIDQEALHTWHIKDPVTLVTSYVRGLAPLIELEKKAQSLGFKDFSEMRTQISRDLHSEFISKSEGKAGRAITKEDAKLKSLRKDINASLDIIQGIYQQGSNVMSTKPAKFFENFRAYNALRMLGGITISSLPDIGRIAMQNGVFNTIFHGLIPMVQGANKISKQDIRALGYSIESELGMRINMFMDQETLSTNPGFMTKTFSTLSQGFGDLTLFNQWTSLTERVAGNLSINDTLSTIHNIVAGKKVSKRSRTRLAQLGIEDTYFEYIAEQTSKPDNISTNNTRVADWTSWDVRNEFEAEALRQYQAAIAKDIEVTLNYPNAGDIPLVGHSVAGRLLLQFKTFMFSVTNKTLITGIQRRKDVETYTGIVSMLGLGALGYVLSSYSKGKEPDMSFQNLAKEAIDRSGMLGVLMEAVDIGHALNILPGTGVSRYQTRGVLGAVLGPTYGTVADILPMIYKAGAVAKGNEEFTTKDVKSLTRLLPFQNIFYMNWLSDQLVTETGNTFNLIENREGY